MDVWGTRARWKTLRASIIRPGTSSWLSISSRYNEVVVIVAGEVVD